MHDLNCNPRKTARSSVRLALLAVCLSAPPSHLNAAVFHLAPTGHDTNSARRNNPLPL